MNEEKHLYGIDLLRGIAAFGIVGCHLMLSPRTPSGSAITHFCDMNVAVFGVIAGYFTHASAALGVKGDILRRLKRLLPVYAIWTLIFLAASFVFKVAAHDDLSQYTTSSFWLNAAFFGGSSTHLWFIAVLVYTQVFALTLLHIKVPRGLDWLLGLIGIGLSVSLSNWWGYYFFRLFGFVWLGIAVRGILWGGWKTYGILTCFTLLAHIGLSGIVPGFLRDMLVAVPLVLFAARLPLGGGGILSPLARILGATSMGVYLVHPLITKFGWVLATRVCAQPYSAGVVLLDWTLCWAIAFIFAALIMRVPCLSHYLLFQSATRK